MLETNLLQTIIKTRCFKEVLYIYIVADPPAIVYSHQKISQNTKNIKSKWTLWKQNKIYYIGLEDSKPDSFNFGGEKNNHSESWKSIKSH